MTSPVNNSNIFRNLLSTTSILFFHVKFSSMIMPRNLIEFSLLVSMLLNAIVDSCNRGDSHIDSLWNKTYFILFVFSGSLFAKNHSLKKV